MTDVNSALEKLSEKNFGRYGHSKPLPNERDRQVMEFLKLFTQLSANEREDIRNQLTLEQSSILGGFANRMASLAVHKKDEESIYMGLLAVFVEGFREDPRESVISQSLLYTSCKMLGFDFQAISNRAIPYGPEVTRDAIQKYIARPEESKGAEAMDYIIDLDSSHIIYKRNWNWG